MGVHDYYASLLAGRASLDTLYQYSMRNRSTDSDFVSDEGTARVYKASTLSGSPPRPTGSIVFDPALSADHALVTIPIERSDLGGSCVLAALHGREDVTPPDASKHVTRSLITWDAWWAREFDTEAYLDPLVSHKAFQFEGRHLSSGLWWETRADYAWGGKAAGEACRINIRCYPYNDSPYGIAHSVGSGVEGAMTEYDPMQPYTVFTVQTETWTRFWAYYEWDQVASGDVNVPTAWSRMSMWVADETREAVQIVDRIAVNASIRDGWGRGVMECFWWEFDTSNPTRPVGGGQPPLYIRVRNLYVGRANATDPTTILDRPLSPDIPGRIWIGHSNWTP